MALNFEDPLEPFRTAFHSLLGPKRLTRADLQNQQLMYETDGVELAVPSLSSGEREVVNIAFDFILRSPSDCIIFFDEPELHLHPELLSRLIATLRSIGERNQFIFVSHSPEIVSASLDDTVVLLTPPNGDRNQAVIIRRNDESTQALRTLGQSIGILSLGKRIVLIEGTDASIDKQTYTSLIRGRFDDLVLLPSGGRADLESFQTVAEKVLDKSLWGVEFFMLVDRDVKIPDGVGTGRIRSLNRYHLENYFLDAELLSHCFNDMEPENSWLRDKARIEAELIEIAKETLSYATALRVSQEFRFEFGNLSLMPKGVAGLSLPKLKAAFEQKLILEELRFGTVADVIRLSGAIEDAHSELTQAISDGSWQIDLPGKPILSRFSAKAKIEPGRLKTLYLKVAEAYDPHPMQDIIDIFQSFSALRP
jgi:hypothetical protein